MRRATLGVLACGTALLAGCVHPGTVERAYDGDVVEGRFVPPDAYAAFLRGAMAEAGHRTDEALAAYAEAATHDPESPEPWARIARVRCERGPDAEADRAVDHALALDPEYAPAWTARATCAAARGDLVVQRAAAARAAALDPEGDGANVLLARAEPSASTGERTRAVLVALTVTARDPVTAWDALASWAESHGEIALWARSLVELARICPERRHAVARAAEELAGAGDVAEARAVAAAALEATGEPLPERLALAARLAVDEAIARRDAAAVLRRATRGRVPVEEGAARALLAGDRALARRLASAEAMADPGSLGARLVVAAADGGGLASVAEARSGDAPASAASVVAFGAAVVLAGASADARAAVSRLPRAALVAGDERVVRSAVDLVSRGALPRAALPADGLVELAVVEGGSLSPGELEAADARLDARHRLLALALALPDSPRARDLSARLRRVASSDAIVASALALIQLASGAPIPSGAPRALLLLNPADSLLAATALRLAEKVGDTEVARRARETLTALGKPSRRTLD